MRVLSRLRNNWLGKSWLKKNYVFCKVEGRSLPLGKMSKLYWREEAYNFRNWIQFPHSTFFPIFILFFPLFSYPFLLFLFSLFPFPSLFSLFSFSFPSFSLFFHFSFYVFPFPFPLLFLIFILFLIYPSFSHLFKSAIIFFKCYLNRSYGNLISGFIQTGSTFPLAVKTLQFLQHKF